MSDSENYASSQQPTSGYSDAGPGGASANYSEYQNPTSPYGQTAGPASTLIAGMGNGVNLQPSYSNGGNVDLGWDLMKKRQQIKSLRIEIEAGQEANAKRWIKEAVNNKYAVVATFHNAAMLTDDQLLMDDPNELLKAAGWWVQNYPTLRKAGPFTINLMNEWGSHGITPDDFAATYNKAIAMVRQVYDGPIVVDLPGFGQEVHTAKLAVTNTAGTTISDRNIILSTHVYPDAWSFTKQREMTTADIDELASTGLDCIVGEFGNQPSGGKAKWDDLVKAAKSKGWPVFGWAWNGDGRGMNMIQPAPFQPFVPRVPYQYTPSPYLKAICDLLSADSGSSRKQQGEERITMGNNTYADAQNPSSLYVNKDARSSPNSAQVTGPHGAQSPSRRDGSSAVTQANTLLQRFSQSTRPGAWHPSLDRKKVASRLSDLIGNPDKLNQGANGLCGEAAFFNVWLWEDPLAVTRFGVQLYNSGAAAVGTEEWVRPRKSLRDQKFSNVVAQMKKKNFADADQWCAEWMLMSALRDANNWIISYDGTPSDDWGAGSSDREIVNWLEATELFSTVSRSGSRQQNNFAAATKLNPKNDIIILSIDSHMLGNDPHDPPEDNHDIVLRSAIIEGDNATVDFRYWSWGEPVRWVNDRRTYDFNPPLPELSRSQFTKEFFGYVIARR